MFLLGEPSGARISEFLRSQRDATFSYEEVGASREGAKELAGYAVDHNRARLGEGEATFDRAVAVLARHHGFRSLNACRIVYLICEDDGDVRRCGFAYGTLPEHGERGQERFTVEWRRDDGSVHYELYAFSRPNKLLSRVGYPLARRLQRRFARDSMRAIAQAVLPR